MLSKLSNRLEKPWTPKNLSKSLGRAT